MERLRAALFASVTCSSLTPGMTCPAEDGTVSSLPVGTGRAVGPAACHERVAVHLERAGLALAVGAAEGVDRLTGYYVGEAAVLQHLLPARTGQPAGYSTGPQVDVAQCLDRYRAAVGDV